MTAGARNAKRERRIAVKVKTGERYRVIAFDKPAIIVQAGMEARE